MSGKDNEFSFRFQGLGRLVEAAEQFIAATKADALDGRALRHLEEMMEAHPEIGTLRPGLEADLALCREAVAWGRLMTPHFQELWQKLRKENGKPTPSGDKEAKS